MIALQIALQKRQNMVSNHRQSRWLINGGFSRGMIVAFVALLFVGAVPVVQAQERPLSIGEAVQSALEENPGVASADWDRLAALAKADTAAFRFLPSLSLTASYQRLSELEPSSMDFPNPFGAGTISFEFPASLSNVFALSVNLHYPIFAGFRLCESLSIARLTADSKECALEMAKRALIFEVRHSYWEAFRAGSNVRTLRKNLELMRSNYRLLTEQAAIGAVTQADLLAADARTKQAEMDLGNAVTLQKRACLLLASLISAEVADLDLNADPEDAAVPFTLLTQPEEEVPPGLEDPLNEKELIDMALAHRPETRASALSVETAEHSAVLAASDLYPTVVIVGNYTLADPNQRVAFQTDPWKFTGTWSLGIQVSYDLGAIPVNIEDERAQNLGVRKARADAWKQRTTVILDVRTCVLNLTRARNDLDIIAEMVGQARENARVVEQRYEAGTVNEVDKLSAELSLLRAEFAVVNKRIDVQIAAADLARAVAMEDLP